MHNLSYEIEFYLHVNGNSCLFERLYTKTRFEKEVQGNSEMAYYGYVNFVRSNQRFMKLFLYSGF